MQLAMVGLGRMGFNMTQRLIEHGHSVVVFDLNTEAIGRAGEKGAIPSTSLAELAGKLPTPRVVWVMIPSGDPTEQTINAIAEHLQPGDMIIDGGNSNYKDSMRRGEALKAKGIHFLDCGTSGGVWGLANGYCLMVGGDQDAYNHAEPIFKALAPENGCAHVGPLGAGHFTKMVHNGIEYGMLQAYAEGFEIMHASKFGLDMGQLAALWGHGSVVRSWMLELAERAFTSEGSDLAEIKGWVADSGEGRWTVQAAIDLDVPAPVITLSLLQRFVSRQDESYGAKVIATIRNEFGGHAVKKQEG
jgi:6-phosphogluconate dehydrogenase